MRGGGGGGGGRVSIWSNQLTNVVVSVRGGLTSTVPSTLRSSSSSSSNSSSSSSSEHKLHSGGASNGNVLCGGAGLYYLRDFNLTRTRFYCMGVNSATQSSSTTRIDSSVSTVAVSYVGLSVCLFVFIFRFLDICLSVLLPRG